MTLFQLGATGEPAVPKSSFRNPTGAISRALITALASLPPPSLIWTSRRPSGTTVRNVRVATSPAAVVTVSRSVPSTQTAIRSCAKPVSPSHTLTS